jgi:hypothetical protein
MQRRTFLKTAGITAVAAGFGLQPAQGFVPAHNWEKYDFGSSPLINDRLFQGPFPQYPPEEVLPGSSVVMATTPSKEVVPNYGMGLTVYVSGDFWPPRTRGDSIEKYCEDLVKIPFASKIYIRLNWRDIQKQPGRLDFPEGWKLTFDLARQYSKRVGFRIMLENPDFPEPGMPEFLMAKVPYVKLKGEWNRRSQDTRSQKEHRMPRYDHPEYQAAFRELNALLAQELNGNPQVEYMDTMMYGFWGEGHTWPYEGNPFPDNVTAEKTWMSMMETQLEFWTRTPLVTNTQPDFSRVGNAEMLDRTIRTHNWLRTDTIFIENEQIEALSNRPPWVAAICEVGMTTADPQPLQTDDGVTLTENIIAHVMDVGANYWSLWHWHNIAASHILGYYEKYPDHIDAIARAIGYRIRPSWIWSFERDGFPGLVLGLVNDGIACVPGVLRISVLSTNGETLASGCLDPGYPHTRGVRQAMFMLPAGTAWQGLRIRAELEVKGERYPVTWACRQKLNPDGTLTLRATQGI